MHKLKTDPPEYGPAMRTRNKSGQVYMSESQQHGVMLFLQTRLSQSRSGLDKICYGITENERRILKGQIDWFKTEQSVIRRLISTVNHPVFTEEKLASENENWQA